MNSSSKCNQRRKIGAPGWESNCYLTLRLRAGIRRGPIKEGFFRRRGGSARLGGMRDNEFTKILGWPGYRVFRHEIDATAKTLRLWVTRKRGNRKLICSGCGRKFSEAHDYSEREVRDLPWGEYRTTVIIEVYRVCCPNCGIRVEKVPQLPSKGAL